MRVAFVLSRISNLGPFIVARDIVKHLRHKADAVDVYYLKASEDNLTFDVPCKKIEFFQRISFQQYDVVHSHGFIADAYVNFHRRHIKAKQLATVHQRIAPDYAMKYNRAFGYLFEKIWCRFLRKNHHVVALTNELCRYYAGKISTAKLSFIYNGIDVPEQLQRLSSDEMQELTALRKQYKIIGLSARLIHLKGVDQVIRFLALQPSFVFVIIGDGEKREELEALAKQLGVHNRCLFLGYKENAVRYFAYFDAYIMSSRSEGFGLCVMEAASQKVPVVCSDLPVYREIFDDEVVRFELENIASLSAAVESVLKQKEALSEKLHRKYKQCFTAETMAGNYLSLYKRLLQQ